MFSLFKTEKSYGKKVDASKNQANFILEMEDANIYKKAKKATRLKKRVTDQGFGH